MCIKCMPLGGRHHNNFALAIKVRGRYKRRLLLAVRFTGRLVGGGWMVQLPYQ